MHELVAIARQEAAESRGVYISPSLNEGITHAELQQLAVEALVACGYRVFYQPDSRMSPSGFPDLLAVNPQGPDPLLAIEIKVGGDQLRPGQELWRDDLSESNGCAVILLRPEHWQSFLSWIDDGHVARGRELLKGGDQTNGAN